MTDLYVNAYAVIGSGGLPNYDVIANVANKELINIVGDYGGSFVLGTPEDPVNGIFETTEAAVNYHIFNMGVGDAMASTANSAYGASIYTFAGIIPTSADEYAFVETKQDKNLATQQIHDIQEMQAHVMDVLSSIDPAAMKASLDLEMADIATLEAEVADIYTELGSKADLVGGKVPINQLPAIAITSVTQVASQVAQLALTAQEGDIAIRTDQSKTYIHNAGTAGTMADWTEILTPTGGVASFNSRTGAVTPQSGDYNTSQVTESTSLYFTDERAQDAVGGILSGEFIYNDSANTIALRQPSFSTPTRAVNTNYQPSASRYTVVYASARVAVALTLLVGGAGEVILETASDAGFTANVREWGRTGISGGAGIALSQSNSGQLIAKVPPNYYYRFRTATTVGTPTYTILSTQEELV